MPELPFIHRLLGARRRRNSTGRQTRATRAAKSVGGTVQISKQAMAPAVEAVESLSPSMANARSSKAGSRGSSSILHSPF
jgi:hypothetical protein